MISKAMVSLMMLVLLAVTCSGKSVPNQPEFEMNSENASMFLNSDQNAEHMVSMDKREIGKNCVPCKIGLNPCCAPNICVKRRFWFDECMEIKVAKIN